jgi:hypothetical protein
MSRAGAMALAQIQMQIPTGIGKIVTRHNIRAAGLAKGVPRR